ILRVSWRFTLETNVKSPCYSYNMCFIGCLRLCGTFGKFACLSFNGNKIITTSGGGALVCRTVEEAKRTKFYATQARDDAPHYQHSHVGYNYRLSNICAGIGRGQMEGLDGFIARRREINGMYRRLLGMPKGLFAGAAAGSGSVPGITFLTNPSEDFESNHWLTCIIVDPEVTGFTREDLRLRMEKENIETRPLWKPMHLQPVFAGAPFYTHHHNDSAATVAGSTSNLPDSDNSICGRLFRNGLCLPSGAGLSNEDIKRVAGVIRRMSEF
ncbi:MAG TPA: hypothetical protein GXX64_09395, partial [Bacteroidales bacterium]|nr:hypothetical protein [Bacteroidales bacterium]